jgi:hypothetical protein
MDRRVRRAAIGFPRGRAAARAGIARANEFVDDGGGSELGDALARALATVWHTVGLRPGDGQLVQQSLHYRLDRWAWRPSRADHGQIAARSRAVLALLLTNGSDGSACVNSVSLLAGIDDLRLRRYVDHLGVDG